MVDKVINRKHDLYFNLSVGGYDSLSIFINQNFDLSKGQQLVLNFDYNFFVIIKFIQFIYFFKSFMKYSASYSYILLFSYTYDYVNVVDI